MKVLLDIQMGKQSRILEDKADSAAVRCKRVNGHPTQAVTESWRGNLFRIASGEPALSESVWWSKAQTKSGFAFEMSGWVPLEQEVHSEQILRRLLIIPGEAELITYSDPRRAVFRYAGFVHGRLAGCVFFGPPGQDFAGVEQAKSLLGKEVTSAERISLLAGLEAGDHRSRPRSYAPASPSPKRRSVRPLPKRASHPPRKSARR